MPAEAKSAAVCILIRGGREPEVLLAKRSPALRFMAGQHVFPGGRTHAQDDARLVVGAADDQHARAILAAAREVFEETGLLCVRGALPSPAERREARRRLLAGELDFGELLQARGLAIVAEDFQPAGQWVTPPFVPIRFATRYFLHYLAGEQQEELIEGEIVGLDWLTPAEARRRWHRGEIRLSTPVAYTLRQLAAGLPAALARLERGTERAPGEHNWFEIRRGITLVPLKSATIPPATHTNCLVIGEESLVVIDPGADDPRELDHLVRQLDHLVELGGRVEAVLLTHSHPDHTAGADELRRRFDVPILAHPLAAAQLPFAIDGPLDDGQVIAGPGDSPWRLECIHTPGHDPGHLCFLETSTGALLAGDMLANPGTIVVSRQFGGDMAQFMQSLERLLAVECKLIIPAHGEPLGRPRAFLQQQLAHRRWREAKIQSALQAGAGDFERLLAAVYDDAPAAALPWARHALDAHLAKLGIELPGGV